MSVPLENPPLTAAADHLPVPPIAQAPTPAVVRMAGAAGIVVGVVVLVGWVLDVQSLMTVLPGQASLKVNTALAFLFAGSSLVAWTVRNPTPISKVIQRAAAIGTALIGGATLAEYLFDHNYGIDELLLADRSSWSGSSHPGRPSFGTAANFVLLGVALLLLPSNRVGARRVAPVLALMVVLVAGLGLLGYLFGVQSLYQIAFYSTMAVHTAATFLVLGVGVLYARTDFAFMAPFRSPNFGGVMARRLIPPVVVLPVIFGWLGQQGEYLGLYELEFGMALFVLSNIGVLSCVVWWVSSLMNRLDVERQRSGDVAKDVLRQSEQRIRLAQQIAAIGTFEWNLQTGVNTWMPELESMYGLSTGQFRGSQLAWEQLVHQDDRAKAIAIVEKALATREPQEGEWRVSWPDGSIHWLVGRFQLFNDPAGNPLRLIGVNIDITARKAMEQSLRESEALANAVLDTAADAIVTIDAGGLIHSVNQATERLFGYTCEELLGQNVKILMPQPYHGRHDEYLRNYLTTGKKTIIGIGREVQARRKDGSIFPVDLSVSEVDLVGRRLFTGIVRDLTERHRVERASEAHRAELAHVLRLNTMGEMAAGLAHEINQPLSAIHNYARGTIRRLSDGACSPSELIEIATAIAEESARASTIIQRLKHYVKKGAPERKLLDVNAIVRHAQRIMAIEADRRSVVVAVDCDPDLPNLLGDPIQLEQVIINLLLNGFEATEAIASERRLAVQTETNGASVVITVADNGPGLPAKFSEMIFQPFYTTKPHGLGMGLAISRSIAEAHEGVLRAESNPQGGAVFRLELPIQHESGNGE